MPLYDYGCKNCGHAWEEARSISGRLDPVSESCPHCKQTGSVEKDMNATRIVTGVNLNAKVPAGFKEVLAKIKERNPHHKIGGDIS